MEQPVGWLGRGRVPGPGQEPGRMQGRIPYAPMWGLAYTARKRLTVGAAWAQGGGTSLHAMGEHVCLALPPAGVATGYPTWARRQAM